MGISAAGIIFSSLNDNNLSRLTTDRAIGAIPFACRYRLVDFCISNLVNANISNINIVANYNYRSLVEHIGSGKDFDLARRKGGINVISPYQTAKYSSPKIFSTHLEALKNMREYIDEFSEEFVVLMDCDLVLNIDIAQIIKDHEKMGANITVVTKKIDERYSSKNPRLMVSSVAGRVSDLSLSRVYTERNPELCLNIFVMRTVFLKRIIEESIAYNLDSLTEYLLKGFKHINCRTYSYSGYVCSVSSFRDYYKSSMELINGSGAAESLLWRLESPVYTRVHNSSPSIYKDEASITNSMIADECVIEGTVINSVLFRGVKVARGAVVKNSVLFGGTTVCSDASLNCIVSDKNVTISEGVVLSGNENMPFYIQKGKKI